MKWIYILKIDAGDTEHYETWWLGGKQRRTCKREHNSFSSPAMQISIIPGQSIIVAEKLPPICQF